MTPQECREARARLRVTPCELARRAGLAERTVLRFEAGLAQPRPVTLVAIRKGFRTIATEQGR